MIKSIDKQAMEIKRERKWYYIGTVNRSLAAW